MRTRIARTLILASAATALGVLAGCASTPPVDGEQRAATVKVYEQDQPPRNSYDVVRRLWVDTRHAAFRLPTSPGRDEAIAALQAESARLGADALVNVNCLNQDNPIGFQKGEPTVLCYGVAVRFRPREG